MMKQTTTTTTTSSSSSTSSSPTSSPSPPTPPPQRLRRSSHTTSICSSLADYQQQKLNHDSVEQELIDNVCLWCYRVLVYLVGIAGVILWLRGQPNYINPASVSLVTYGSDKLGLLTSQNQVALALIYLGLVIVRHSLSQGCSASLVPALFVFFPSAFGFLYRSRKAVMLSTVGVLGAVIFIYGIDLSGKCTTNAIEPDDKGSIFADRFMVLFNAIVGNCLLLLAIVSQSQRSSIMHAQAAQSAASLADIRRDVLHRVTHELRTPLNGIVGSVELLVSSESLQAVDMENALTIKSCLNTIVNICDNVLLAAKSNQRRVSNSQRRNTTIGNSNKQIQQNNNSNHPSVMMASEPNNSHQSPSSGNSTTTFRLASVIDTVSEIFAATAWSQGIALKVEYLAPDVYVQQGDNSTMELELRQTISNLVGNSLKFTESGSVTIRVIAKREEEEEANNSNNGSTMITCRFEVQDTGIGVDMNTRHLLFEAFHQGEQGIVSAVSRKHQGTGLGLTICKDLVQQMGGHIDVESGGLGKGTTFYFTLTLPLVVKKMNKTEDLTTTPPPPSSPSCRVLIYDQEEGSSQSCLNMIRPVCCPPNSNEHDTKITVVHSMKELLDIVVQEKKEQEEDDDGDDDGGDDDHYKKKKKQKKKKIAFVDCDGLEATIRTNALQQIGQAGWYIIAICGQDDFVNLLVDSSSRMWTTSVFRRPLPLVRISNALTKIIMKQEQEQEEEQLPPPPPPPPALSNNNSSSTNSKTTTTATTTVVQMKSSTSPTTTTTTMSIISKQPQQHHSKQQEESDDGDDTTLVTTTHSTSAKTGGSLLQQQTDVLSGSRESHKDNELLLPLLATTNATNMTEGAAAAAGGGGEESSCKNNKNPVLCAALPPPPPPAAATAGSTNHTAKGLATAAAAAATPNNNNKKKKSKLDLGPRTKIIAVDDTAVNVKVLTKMLERSTSSPIYTCMDGQSAVEIVSSSSPEDKLLFLMDWHMPGLCGLSASEAIAQLVQQQQQDYHNKNGGDGGDGDDDSRRRCFPECHVCMVTADIEGLYLEMDRRQISPQYVVTKGSIFALDEQQQQPEEATTTTAAAATAAMANHNLMNGISKKTNPRSPGCSSSSLVRLVAEKPVTFKSVMAILEWFRDELETQ